MITMSFTGHDSQSGGPAAAAAPNRVAKASKGLIIGTAIAVVSMWLFIWLADEVMDSAAQTFDAQIVHYLHVHASPILRRIMSIISQIASGPGHLALIACAALYFQWQRRFLPSGLTMIVAGTGGAVLNEALKRLFHRVRPEPAYYHLGYSFPSGHAMSAVIVYGLLAYLLAREVQSRWRILVWVAAIMMILLVGFSRVYLGVHYPTDVIGGYLAGACWLWGCITWLHVLERRRLAAPAVHPKASTDQTSS